MRHSLGVPRGSTGKILLRASLFLGPVALLLAMNPVFLTGLTAEAATVSADDAPSRVDISRELWDVLARADSIAALDALLLVASREGDFPSFLNYSDERHRHSSALHVGLVSLLQRQDPALAEHGKLLVVFLPEPGKLQPTLRVLLPYIETIPDTLATVGHFCLAAGLMLGREGKHAEAERYFERASHADFPLTTHSLYLAIESAAASGDLPKMLELEERLEGCEPAEHLLRRARIVVGLALADSSRDSEARQLLEAALESETRTREKIQTAYALGRLYEKSEEHANAARSYGQAFEKTASAEEAVEAARAYLRLVREGKAREDESTVLSAAQCLLRTGQRLEARLILEKLFRNGEGSLKAGWRLGRVHYRTKKYNDAARIFKKLETLERQAKDSSRALLWVARCKRELGRTEEAIRLFRRVSVAGRHVVCTEAAWELGMELEGLGRLKEATESYGFLHRRFPATRLGEEGLWRKGLCEYKQGSMEKARFTFASLATRRTRSTIHDMAAFWMLKCTFEAGDSLSTEELEQLQPRGNSLYGLLLKSISETGGANAEVFRTPWLRRNAPVGSDEDLPRSPSVEQSGTSERAQELSEEKESEGFALQFDDESPEDPTEELSDGLPAETANAVALLKFGLRELAREELRLSEKKLSGNNRSLFFLAQLYWRNEFHRQGLSLADRLLRSGKGITEAQTRFLKRMLHPIYSIEVVLEESRSQAVDPFLVLSVMRRESSFNPEAVSPAGATGVMQLMPGTAGEIAAYLGEADPVSDLRDPQLNIRYGVWLLGRLVGRYSDSVVAALAAYNAGEHNAERWMKRAGTDDEFLLMESISFRETREYVRRVLGDFHTYGSLYAQ